MVFCMMCLDVRTSSFRSTLPKTRFVSREATTFEIFQRGVSPVEAEPGKSREIGHRISRVGRFRHGVAQRTGQRANCVISNRLPRFRIKACSALVPLQMELVWGFLSRRSRAENKITLCQFPRKVVFRVACTMCN